MANRAHQDVADTDRVASKRRIMDAAFDLMAEYGYAGTTISMICKRSGLPPSSAYWHFGNKDGLLAAVVDDASRRWLGRLPRWQDLRGSTEQKLRRLLAGVADAIIDDPMPSRLFLLLTLEIRPSENERPLDTIRATHRAAGGALRLAFRELNPSAPAAAEDLLVSFTLALANGAVLAQLTEPGVDIHALFARLAESFVHLASAGSKRGRGGTKKG